jgi:hypothetical protein
MWKQEVLRVLFFVVFFAIGAASLSGAIVCDELLNYYRNRQVLKSAEENTDRLKSLIADYNVLLQQFEDNPKIFERIAPAMLGTESADSNAVYPKATAELLAETKTAMAEESAKKSEEPAIAHLLARCNQPFHRAALFLAGAFLIIISFVCFGPAHEGHRK